MNIIKIDNRGTLTLGNKKLPGQIESVSIKGKMVLDSAQMEGSSGKKKVFGGYSDADLSINITLLEDTDGKQDRYKSLEIVNRAFKKLEGGVPVVYSVDSRISDAMNVKHLLFNEMSVDDSSLDDSLSLSLSFTEHNPVVSLVQEQQTQSPEDTSLSADEIQEDQPEEIEPDAYREMRRLEKIYG